MLPFSVCINRSFHIPKDWPVFKRIQADNRSEGNPRSMNRVWGGLKGGALKVFRRGTFQAQVIRDDHDRHPSIPDDTFGRPAEEETEKAFG